MLESKLIAGTPQESKGTLGGFVGSTKFDTHGFAKKMWEVLLHLPIKNEGNIGIKLLLELKELALSEVPGSGLEHRKDQDILTGVMGKSIKHACPLNPRTGRGRIRTGQIFTEGNHI